MKLYENRALIDKEIVDALIIATPEYWNAAEMFVERHDDGVNERMLITILSPEGHKDLIQATDEIYSGLYKLSDSFRREGRMWSSVRYKIFLTSEKNWQYRADFEY